jgi:hypothetical protein
MRSPVAFSIVLALASSCVTTTEDELPNDDELSALDQWATTADGKADLPTTWTELVAWLRDVYTNRMSAVWHGQEHPATSAAAIDRIHGMVVHAGVDPTHAKFRVTVRKLVSVVDHSEINIALPGGETIRLVGDPKGAGAFVDSAPFQAAVGPSLCLTWSELQTAVSTSYVPGEYGVNFVCHTVTERVLRALDVGTAPFATKYRTYASARWVWGPQVPSFNSQDPSKWAVSRSCD